jgi:hypothetical protein
MNNHALHGRMCLPLRTLPVSRHPTLGLQAGTPASAPGRWQAGQMASGSERLVYYHCRHGQVTTPRFLPTHATGPNRCHAPPCTRPKGEETWACSDWSGGKTRACLVWTLARTKVSHVTPRT